MKRFVLFLMVTFYGTLANAAGTPPLEMQVNLSLNNERITAVLEKIHDQTGLIFSYQADIFNDAAPVSMQLKNKTVREALALVLPKNIGFKARSKYIILKEKPAEKDAKKTEISGYVIDKNTDQKLANVTLYDKTTLQSVTTDQYGFYSITVPKDQCLSVNKESYRDTCVAPAPDSPITNITMVSDSATAKDTVEWRLRLRDFSSKTNELFKQFKGYINTLNVKDTFTRSFQASLLPFVGTNGLMSGNVYNDVSFNALGGYSRGTKILELGGIFNVARQNVTGAQIAGMFNVVGDSVEGAQVAGLFNVTGGHIDGLQAAGIYNFNLGKTQGFQVAGIFNMNIKELNGAQFAGIANFNYKGFTGVSGAGIVNMSRFSVMGTQVAGITNICADTMEGSSVAGIVNMNWYSKGVEVAGFLNSSRFGGGNTQISGLVNNTAKGSTNLQVAGIFNRAGHLKGTQVALFNYADSASGIPFGLLSFVREGVHQLELSSDEVFHTNIGFRTGVNAFYNIINIGLEPGPRNLWSFGYGFGTSFKINNKLRADLTVTANHVSVGSFYHATSELYKFYAGVEYKFMNKISLAVGPTFNLYWTDALLPDYQRTYKNLLPYHSSNTALANDFNLKGWFGIKAAIRFL